MSDLDDAPATHSASPEESALDLLEREDQELLQVFSELAESREESSIESRARYGDLAKNLVRHVATREAALIDVSTALAAVDGAEDQQATLNGGTDERRQAIDEVERMSRGVQGINLNTGQDFDAALLVLTEVLMQQIQRDLHDSIPTLRELLSPEQALETFHSAADVVRHAPTSLNPKGPAWYERAPVISRMLTIYDRLRDFPRASRRARD